MSIALVHCWPGRVGRKVRDVVCRDLLFDVSASHREDAVSSFGCWRVAYGGRPGMGFGGHV